MKKLLTAFLLLVMLLAGCSGKPEALQFQRKPVVNCLWEAILFYSKGGDVFDDKGCDITTHKSSEDEYIKGQTYRVDYVIVNSHNRYKNINSTVSCRCRAEWLRDPQKLSVLEGELVAMGKCLNAMSSSNDDKSRNPLNKQDHSDLGCDSYSLTVNNDHGMGVTCTNAPHLTFEALEK
jgi:hypothetical protein